MPEGDEVDVHGTDDDDRNSGRNGDRNSSTHAVILARESGDNGAS